LLIFFMVAGQIARTDPIKVEPLVSDSEKQTGDRQLQILLAADGRLRLGGLDVPAVELESRLRPLLAAGGPKIVHLKSDGKAEARAVIGVLERIKNAGAEKVKLLTTARPDR